MPWWNQLWKVRRELRINPTSAKLPGEDVAYAHFVVGEHCEEDGSDIRIVHGMKPIPFKVIYRGEGAFATVAWPVQEGKNTYYAYLGNPGAKPAKSDWDFKRGLVLETRQFRGGNPSSWAAMRYILNKSTEVMGRSFVDRIYFGYNPHGPSVNNVNVFTGYLNCRSAGRYEFYTSSSDASFVMVNGRMVVQWPGWHGPIGRARFKGVTTLSRGLHKIEYFHVQGGGRQVMAAYWKPPGKGSIEIIPASAFAPVARAVVASFQNKAGRFLPDFWPSNSGEAVLGDRDDVFLVKMHFENQTPRSARVLYRCQWDFGDGTQSREVSPDHVYLVSGIYKVTLNMSHGSLRYRFTSPVVVERDWKHLQTARKIDSLSAYYPLIKDYPLKLMEPRAVHNAAWVFEKLGRTTDMAKAVRALLTTREKVSDPLLVSNATRLVKYLVSVGKWKDALAALEQAEGRAEGVAVKADFAVGQARIRLSFGADPTGARKAIDKVFSSYAKAKPQTLRWAHILRGDTQARLVTSSAEDAYKAARADYEKAEKLQAGIKARGRHDEVAIPAISRSLEDYLRRRELEVAEQLLDEWELRKPTDKLVGYYTLLRAEWWCLKKQYNIAAEILQALIEVNPASPYGDQALWRLADCHAAMRDYPKAVETLNRVEKMFPESPLVEKVPARIKDIRKPPAGAGSPARPARKIPVRKKRDAKRR